MTNQALSSFRVENVVGGRRDDIDFGVRDIDILTSFARGFKKLRRAKHKFGTCNSEITTCFGRVQVEWGRTPYSTSTNNS